GPRRQLLLQLARLPEQVAGHRHVAGVPLVLGEVNRVGIGVFRQPPFRLLQGVASLLQSVVRLLQVVASLRRPPPQPRRPAPARTRPPPPGRAGARPPPPRPAPPPPPTGRPGCGRPPRRRGGPPASSAALAWRRRGPLSRHWGVRVARSRGPRRRSRPGGTG